MVSTMNRYKNALKSHGFYHEKVQKCFSHNEKKLSNWVESVCLCLKSLVIFGEIQIHVLLFFESCNLRIFRTLILWFIFVLCVWDDGLKSKSWEEGNVDKVILCRREFLQRDCGVIKSELTYFMQFWFSLQNGRWTLSIFEQIFAQNRCFFVKFLVLLEIRISSINSILLQTLRFLVQKLNKI